MTRIYFIRHAESVANTQGVYQGQTYDTPLSPLGLKQARALAGRLSGIKFDKVYTSPLLRCCQTAGAFTSSWQADPALLETNHGAWKGRSKTDIATVWPDLYRQWLTQPSQVQFPGGEHFRQTLDRAASWLKSVSASGRTLAAVTHVNIIQALLTRLFNRPLDAIWDFPLQPTSLTLIETHSPAQVIYWGDANHLLRLQSDLNHHAL